MVPSKLVLTCLTAALSLTLSANAAEQSLGETGPFEPQEAARRFVLHPECRIELVACEPDVIDPVAMAFSPDGRLWVVEYSDYPNGPGDGEPGRSRIRVLTDDDGDGRYSNPRVYKDKLLFANGLLPWRDGLIVTTNGRVVFLRDADADGTADEEQIWFQGFTVENPQLRCNDPTLGPDNWIYVANGLRGGSIVPGPQNPWGLDPKSEPVSISGMDFRFDPLTGKHEAISGPGQFGLTFDDWGNRFVCSNRNPNNHLVIDDQQLKQVPWLRMTRVHEEVSPAGEQSRLYPISRFWVTSNLHANQFTAACGVTIYRGTALPPEFYGNSFTCDPTGNLVHRDVLKPRGLTFSSKPDREGIEFLATKDEWFRGVNLAHGPDGALYVCDMYRAVIEHPAYMPDELKTRPDLLLGTDKGRIWRIVAAGFERDRHPPVLLNKLGTAELVAVLDHPNAWQRETAQRLLLQRRDDAAVGPLRTLLQNPAGKFGASLALRLLDAFGVLHPDDISAGLEHPYAQRQALQLARIRALPGPVDTWLGRLVSAAGQGSKHYLQRISTRDPQLMAQLVLNVGWERLPDVEVIPGKAVNPAVLLMFPPVQDGFPAEWLMAAGIISAGSDLPAYASAAVNAVRTGAVDPVESIPRGMRFLAGTLGRRNSADEVRPFLDAVFEGADSARESVWRESVLLGLLEGYPNARTAIGKLTADSSAAVQSNYAAFLRELATRFAAFDGNTADHSSGMMLLTLLDPQEAMPIVSRLAAGTNPGTSLAAIQVLRTLPQPEVGKTLVKLLPTRAPQGRREIISALGVSPSRISLLLDEVEAKRIAPIEIDPNLQKGILNQKDPELAQRAAALLKTEPPEDRVKVLAEYQACLKLASDPLRGRGVFEKTCAVCHKIGDLGVNVAPDISDSRVRTADYLLTHIIDPNRAIDNNFFSFTIVDTQGRIHTGVIETETSTSITLKQPEAKQVTISRSEIEEIRNNGVSLMPVGLEKTIDQQQMADLISFIKNWRYLDSSVPKAVYEQR